MLLHTGQNAFIYGNNRLLLYGENDTSEYILTYV